MYRLVLYYLIVLVGIGLIFSVIKVLPFDPFTYLASISVLLAVGWLTNKLFSKAFKVPTNVESVYISVLILALIVNPIQTGADLWMLVWVAVLAMASKFIIAFNGKHVFNPVAFAVAATALVLHQYATWWVGSGPMLPFVLIGGVLILRKMRRPEMVGSFLSIALGLTLIFAVLGGQNITMTVQSLVLSSPLFFFAVIILTEPLATPPTRRLQMYYGALVGFFMVPQVHFGPLYFTPELAILIGNLFSYIVSPKSTLILTLRDKIRVAPGIYDFVFYPSRYFAFEPGQYMEWTLDHEAPDDRGNRRYFTLASSPTEENLRVGVRFYPDSSTYKQSMLTLRKGSEIVAGQLAGDFTLPDTMNQKIVFITGGIGITPVRSMIKYLVDTYQHRPVVLMYSNRTVEDIAYKEVFDDAEQEIALRTVYTLTDLSQVPQGWWGRVGRIDARMIREEVPDYRDCVFYISGSSGMVEDMTKALRRLRVPKSQIKTDHFYGLA